MSGHGITQCILMQWKMVSFEYSVCVCIDTLYLVMEGGMEKIMIS